MPGHGGMENMPGHLLSNWPVVAFFLKMGQEFIVILFVTNVLSKTFLKIILKQMIAILHLLNDEF
jgi:hypothetical protein